MKRKFEGDEGASRDEDGNATTGLEVDDERMRVE